MDTKFNGVIIFQFAYKYGSTVNHRFIVLQIEAREMFLDRSPTYYRDSTTSDIRKLMEYLEKPYLADEKVRSPTTHTTLLTSILDC